MTDKPFFIFVFFYFLELLHLSKRLSSWLKYESYDVSLGFRMWHMAVRFTYHVNEDTIVFQAMEVWRFLCFIVRRLSLTCKCSNLIQSCKCDRGRVFVSGGRDDKGVIHSGCLRVCVKAPHTSVFGHRGVWCSACFCTADTPQRMTLMFKARSKILKVKISLVYKELKKTKKKNQH